MKMSRYRKYIRMERKIYSWLPLALNPDKFIYSLAFWLILFIGILIATGRAIIYGIDKNYLHYIDFRVIFGNASHMIGVIVILLSLYNLVIPDKIQELIIKKCKFFLSVRRKNG